MIRARAWFLGTGLAALALLAPATSSAQFYQQTNLRSSVAGLDPSGVGDPDLKNPWGMSNGPNTPFWVSDQVTGKSTLYDGLGAKQGLVVTIPGGSPAGQVFNNAPGATDFSLPVGGRATFIFSTLGGSIEGWNGGSGTTAQVVATTPTSAYTGLTIGNNGAGTFLYAANARANRIDVFDSAFHLTNLAGNFVDPTLPAGLTPYGIQVLGNSIYVTYETRGTTAGALAQFDLNGHFIRELGTSARGFPLDEPWAVALAPANFGQFSNDLLVGNKGDGHISAFDPVTGGFLGQLLQPDGTPLANTGLWALSANSGARNTDPNALYFVAGINNETEGLFGSIRAVPEPGSLALLGLGTLGLLGGAYWRRARKP